MPRPYKQKARAAARDETHARIVRAAVAVHEEIGPRAPLSAIAERAGVQRLTLYRHFPDEEALFAACTAHWLAENPPPDPAPWARLNGPARARAGLEALYAYYRRSRRMLAGSYRDEPDVPALAKVMADTRAYLDALAADLARGYGRRAKTAHVARTLRHAVKFETWSSLAEDGLSDAQMVDLALAWIG